MGRKKGFLHSEETKEKMSNSHKRVIHTQQWNKHVSDSLKGKPFGKGKILGPISQERKKKQSEKMKLKCQDLEYIEKLQDRMNNKEIKRRISESNKVTWQNKTDKQKELHISKILKSNSIKPNKTEVIIDALIEALKPNEFKYVGNGEVLIGGKCPDWINTNGKKQVIEFFGTYWHKQDDEENKKEHYKKYGFDCLVIWENELADKNALIEKISSF